MKTTKQVPIYDKLRVHRCVRLLQCIAFHDVNPVSAVHFLVIPRKPIPMLSKALDEDTEVCCRWVDLKH